MTITSKFSRNTQTMNSEAKKVVIDYLNDEMKRQIAIAKMHLANYPAKASYSHFDISYKNSSRSRGGRENNKPFVSFGINEFVEKLLAGDATMTFDEYGLIKADQVIGEVTGTIEKCMSALVAHELAHAIQFSIAAGMTSSCQAYGYSKVQVRKPHGYAWRYIYSILRKYAVNDLQ